MITPSYEYTEKDVRTNGRIIKAIFPKEHSRVKGLIFSFVDSNRSDPWCNRPNWVRFMAIMWKGKNKWEWISDLDCRYSWANIGLGFFSVLYNLEDEKLLRKWEAKDRIKTLTEEIAAKEKLLEEAKDELKTLKYDL